MIHIAKVTCRVVSKRLKVREGKHSGGHTAGLNNPPLILENTHALTAREKPELKQIYNNCAGFCCTTVVTMVVPLFVFEEMLAT